MSRFLFRLPDVGEGVAQAEILTWHVEVGATIAEDQNLLDVMTDKATVEMTSPVSGTVRAIHGEPGAMAPVGSVLVEIDIASEDMPEDAAPEAPLPIAVSMAEDPRPEAPLQEPPRRPATNPTSQRDRAEKLSPAPRATSPRTFGDAPLAAPATRRRAYELGIPLQFVAGSGPGNRITPDDLDAYVAAGGVEASPDTRRLARDGYTETRIIGLRRKIAERMEEAKRRIPHIAYIEEIDVTQLEDLRRELNAARKPDQAKLTLLPFFVRVLVKVLPNFPEVNAHFDDEANVLRSFAGVHVGIATQTDAGLMVPVIRHAERRDLQGLASDIVRLSAAARDGSAARDELTGSTITLSSLGTLGGIASTPILNRPEVAILAPNKIVERPVVESGSIRIRKMMNLSSSFDHRIIDGYKAATFIHAVKRLIEHPSLIFMDDR